VRMTNSWIARRNIRSSQGD